MKRKHSKITSVFLVLVLTAALMTPAAARSPGGCGRSCIRWFWSCCDWYCNTVGQTTPACPSTPTQPSTPAQPSTPTEPSVPTQPVTPVQPDSGSASALERQVAELVNRERAANGLPALTFSTQLSDGARLKSQDMQQNRYFDHNSPQYGSPFDMMRTLGITYAAAGENIAMGYATAEAVVTAWMNSPGHRANILSESYTHIGVGYVASGNYWTQWFTR